MFRWLKRNKNITVIKAFKIMKKIFPCGNFGVTKSAKRYMSGRQHTEWMVWAGASSVYYRHTFQEALNELLKDEEIS